MISYVHPSGNSGRVICGDTVFIIDHGVAVQSPDDTRDFSRLLSKGFNAVTIDQITPLDVETSIPEDIAYVALLREGLDDVQS